jgi:hypothetical protein
MKTLQHDPSEFNVLFVHSEIDDYGLSSQEFRVYAHLARRAGKSGAWPAIDSIAKHCRQNRDTVYECLKRLKELNLIHAHKRPGATTIYTLTPRSQWKPYKEEVSEKEGYPPVSDTPHREQGDTRVSEKRGYKGNPSEGTPSKDNTVRGLSAHDQTNKTPIRDPGSPLQSGPALFQKVADSQYERTSPGTEKQTPIRRKAYAAAQRLRLLHWDNCKVRFVKETARSYAEGALEAGHEEKTLTQAYERALRYCHGHTTDEMCRGERLKHEKASPALTVWLARERLKSDSHTIEERWKEVVSKLTTEKRKAIEEEAKIRQQINEKTHEINVWFAQNQSSDTGK